MFDSIAHSIAKLNVGQVATCCRRGDHGPQGARPLAHRKCLRMLNAVQRACLEKLFANGVLRAAVVGSTSSQSFEAALNTTIKARKKSARQTHTLLNDAGGGYLLRFAVQRRRNDEGRIRSSTLQVRQNKTSTNSGVTWQEGGRGGRLKCMPQDAAIMLCISKESPSGRIN